MQGGFVPVDPDAPKLRLLGTYLLDRVVNVKMNQEIACNYSDCTWQLLDENKNVIDQGKLILQKE